MLATYKRRMRNNNLEIRIAGSSCRPQLLSNDPGKVDSNFFCYAATVLSPNRNVLIFTQRMHKPT